MPINQASIESMWLAIDFYDSLEYLDKENLMIIAKECHFLSTTYPLQRLLTKKFYIKSLDTVLLGIAVITLLTVCTDLLTDGQLAKARASEMFGEWLPLAKGLADVIN